MTILDWLWYSNSNLIYYDAHLYFKAVADSELQKLLKSVLIVERVGFISYKRENNIIYHRKKKRQTNKNYK